MSCEPAESRLDRVNKIWGTLPESFKDVLLGMAELGHRQPDLVEVLAGTTGPKKPTDYPKVLLDNTKAQVSVVDLKGNIRFANEAAKVQLEILTGRREVANIADFLENPELALNAYRHVIETGETLRFVQRPDYESRVASHELYFFQVFPLQEFADTKRKQNVCGCIILPLGEVMQMTEQYLNLEDQGEDIDYLINIKPEKDRKKQ